MKFGPIPRFLMAAIASPECCVPRRCSLCRFTIVPNETFVIVGEDGQIINRFTFLPHFAFNFVSTDELTRVTYRFCHRGCKRIHTKGVRNYACHEECMKLVDSSIWIDFLIVTKPESDHPPSDDNQREAWLTRDLSSILSEALPRFPAELRWEIARYCTREHAVQILHSRFVQLQEKVIKNDVSLTQDIWMNYIEIEGRRYVSSLSNTPAAGDSGEKLCTIHTTRDRVLGTLFVAEDHLGIRDIRFCEADSPNSYICDPPAVSAAPGIWWRSYPMFLQHDPNGEYSSGRFGPPWLRGQGDGLKLRFLHTLNPMHDMWKGCHDRDPTIMPAFKTAWETPQHLTNHPKVRPVNIGDDDWYRMTSVEFNTPNITGYSFGWNNGLCFFHPHTSDDLACYQTAVAELHDGFWFHIPINEGEVIKSIWQIVGLSITPRWRPSSLFVTSLGREVIIGPYHSPLEYSGTGQPKWHAVLTYRHNGSPTRMYLDQSRSPIRGVAFDNTNILSGRRELTLKPQHFSATRHVGTGEYHTFASLEDVVKVTPCWREFDDECCIVGLYLEYSTGRRACVGQCRLDKLGDPLVAKPGQILWLGSRQSLLNEPRVFACEIDETSPSDGKSTFVRCDLKGVLEWQTSEKKDKVIYRPE